MFALCTVFKLLPQDAVESECVCVCRYTSVLKYCAVLKCLRKSLTSCLALSDSCRVCARSLCTARLMSCRVASLSLRAMRANSSCIMACCCSYLCRNTHTAWFTSLLPSHDSLAAVLNPTTVCQCFMLCSLLYDSHLNCIQEKMSPIPIAVSALLGASLLVWFLWALY